MFSAMRMSEQRHSSRGGSAEKVTYRDEIGPIQPPNVIARLMGIDINQTIPPFPPPPKPKPNPKTKPKPKPAAAAAAAAVISPRSEPFRQANKCSLLSYRKPSSRHCLNKIIMRSRSRQLHRHPQEDLLNKLKHDFQAWQRQASKALDSKSIQMIAQENLRNQKMARYAACFAAADTKQAMDIAVLQREADSEPAANEVVASPCAAAAAAASSEKSRDSEAHKCKDGHDHDESGETTPIVLLKPSSSTGSSVDGQQPLPGLPKVQRDGSMSRFLQEVKEMIQKELDVNADTVTWGNYSQPKQIARDTIAKQTRGTVTKDLNKRLFRLESFRAFRSDRRRNEATATTQASPEHVTRNIVLAHRLMTATSTTAETVSLSRQRASRSFADASPSPSGIGFGDQSFRSECLMNHRPGDSVASSRALFRSFSAPESGFSLGRLFGDGSARSSTTREASQDATAMTSNQILFIRGTVSSLRHRFGLRRNLLRRKMHHWSKKTSLGLGDLHPQMAMGTAVPPSPETFNVFKVAQVNLTELPPSPVSPLEAVVGHSCRHFFSDFNCALPGSFAELMSPKCLSEIELGAPAASEVSFRTDDISVETACNHDKAYIREILVAAGLYDDGSLHNRANAIIGDDIYEEVEDMYYYRGKYCDDAIIGMHNDDANATEDHRMLFDLANEALLQSLVQGANAAGSSLRQWVIDTTGVSRGRRLVDDVWQQVQTLRNPQMQEMQTIDSMVAYEIRKSVWAEVLYEDVYVVGRKIERAIFDELIQDLLVDENFHFSLYDAEGCL